MTNHAQEAKKHIEWTHDWQSEEGCTDATGIATAHLAQAHATLALAEQQRIANLLTISCGTPEGAMSRIARDIAYMTLIEDGEDGMLKPEIAAALGIGEQP